MKRHGIVCAGLLALALVALLAFPDTASAQRRRGGGVSVGVGTGYGSAWYGSPYYSSWYGSPYYSSWRSPYYSGYSYPYWSGSYYGSRWAEPSFTNAYPEYYVPGQAATVTSSTSAYAPSNDMPANDRAYVAIQIPGDRADVWIEGQKTEQTQPVQQYVSPQIDPNKKYFYEVRARWTDTNGRAMDSTRHFAIFAGRPVTVDFTRPETKEKRAPAPEELPKPKK